jgi:hypothetical protein
MGPQGLIAFPGNATKPADTNATTHGVVVTRLSLTFADTKGLNRNRKHTYKQPA